MKRREIFMILTMVLALLTWTGCGGSGGGDGYYEPYSPSNPDPETVEKNNPFYVKGKWWQAQLYGSGDMYCSVRWRYEDKEKTGEWVEYEYDGVSCFKIKFYQLVNNPGDNPEYPPGEYPFKGDTFYQAHVPRSADWARGQPPFDLSAKFPEYQFVNEHDPGEKKDVWTAKVVIPVPEEEVVPPNYTPESPKPNCGNNTPPDNGWEVKKYWGHYFYQLDLRDDGRFKIKLNDWNGKEVVSFDCDKLAIPSGWKKGQMPFSVQQLESWFPGIHFATGAPPEGNGSHVKTVWAGGLSIG